MVSASGDPIHVTGVYNLRYEIGTRIVYQPTFVCKNSSNILGIGAIGHLQITWVESIVYLFFLAYKVAKERFMEKLITDIIIASFIIEGQ